MKFKKLSIIERLVVLLVLFAQPGCSWNEDQSYSSTGFILSSPDIGRDSLLPKIYTCQGSSSSLCLTWKGIPGGTVTLALVMDHETSPSDIHCYWIIYDIPPDIDSLPRNATGIGIPGINSVNQKMQYTPPCSQGPGLREYTFCFVWEANDLSRA